MTNESKWYAVSVYARQEKAANEELSTLGFETFLPLIHNRRLWSDRIKTIETALFPGYLFIHTQLDAEKRVRILKPKQVFDLVGRRNANQFQIAQSIPDCEITSLQIAMSGTSIFETTSTLVKGASVQIVNGPFRGAIGIIEREAHGPNQKIAVQISLLKRGLILKVSANKILALSETPNHIQMTTQFSTAHGS